MRENSAGNHDIAVGASPKFVERYLKLSELTGEVSLPKQVARYLQEATRCYVFGFWQASIALARAAVEDDLRTILTDKYGVSAPARFGKIIDACIRCGLLDGISQNLVNVVKEKGDAALRGGQTDAPDARDALVAARGVLEHLHS